MANLGAEIEEKKLGFVENSGEIWGFLETYSARVVERERGREKV